MAEWKSVPVEPTEGMIREGAATLTGIAAGRMGKTRAVDVYESMLAAAPSSSTDTPCDDPIVESVVAMLRARSRTGVAKYGTTLAASQEGLHAFLQHLKEELADAANYVAKIEALSVAADPTDSWHIDLSPEALPEGWALSRVTDSISKGSDRFYACLESHSRTNDVFCRYARGEGPTPGAALAAAIRNAKEQNDDH